jgi:hypothetical protein
LIGAYNLALTACIHFYRSKCGWIRTNELPVSHPRTTVLFYDNSFLIAVKELVYYILRLYIWRLKKRYKGKKADYATFNLSSPFRANPFLVLEITTCAQHVITVIHDGTIA